MDYENKYKQALSRATFYNNELLTENQRKMLLDIFPELKENEDERMKDYIKDVIQAAIIPKKENKQKMIVWLEKQDEQSVEPKWCHYNVDLSNCSEEYRKAYYDGWTNCIFQHSQWKAESDDKSEKIRKEIIEFIKSRGGFKREYIDWLEKQESVGEIVERCKISWYNEGKIDGRVEGLSDDEKYQQGWHDALEKQGKKLTDKIEPKFKVCDFS